MAALSRSRLVQQSPPLGLLGTAFLGLVAYRYFVAPKSLLGRRSAKSLASIEGEAAKKRDELFPENLYTGGAWADLPRGTVKYWLVGPEDGRKIVLISGLSMPSLIFRDIVEALTKANFRILLYDQPGRGYSPPPNPPVLYDTSMHVDILNQLFQHLGWTRSVIVGLSMGGSVAVTFAQLHPQSVDKVALFAPTGLLDAPKPSSKGALQGISAYISAGFATLRSLFVSPSPAPPADTFPADTPLQRDLHELVAFQKANVPSLAHAISRSISDGIFYNREEAYASLDSNGIQTMAIWGTADDVVTFDPHAARAQALIPKMRLVALEGVGHDLTATNPGDVGASLLEFL